MMLFHPRFMFSFVKKRYNSANFDNSGLNAPSNYLRDLNVAENIVQQGILYPRPNEGDSIDSKNSLVHTSLAESSLNDNVLPSYEEVVMDNYYNPDPNTSVFHAECYKVRGSHRNSPGVGLRSKLVEYGYQRSKIYVRD